MEFFKTDFSTLYLGDTLVEMKNMFAQGIRVDKVITSPPYNIVRPNSTDRGYDLYKDGMSNEDYIKWIIEVFSLYEKILNKDGCICWNMSYGTENTECMSLTIAEILKQTNFTLADILVWKKFCATPNNVSKNKMTRIVEFVYIFCRRGETKTFNTNKKRIDERKDTGQDIYENVFNFFEAKNNDETNELNKATFSVDFVHNIIDRYVDKNDIVLDNFVGTGTTLVACEMKSIKGHYIELSENQCKHTVERIKKGIQISLF